MNRLSVPPVLNEFRTYACLVGLFTILIARPLAAQDLAVSGPLRLNIDIPAQNAIVPPSFQFGGWALDLTAAAGTGINAVDVWAMPVSGSPIYVGAATIGVSRPDVSAVVGPQFLTSGFNGIADVQLAPGAYTLYVFARRTSTGTFDIVEQVLITVRGVTLSDLAPCSSGQVPAFDGTRWACSDNSGLQGATGLQGPQGPQGPVGPQGSAGVPCAGCVGNASLQPITGAGLVANSATTATPTNTPNAIVARDGAGNFFAGTIVADLSGHATTATTAITADSATTAITADTATNFTGSLVGNVSGPQGATVVVSVGGASAVDVANGATLALTSSAANVPSAIVRRDGAGNFSAGTITAALAGNATTATTATTAATATTATTATNFDGSLAGDVTGTQGATVVGSVGGATAANVASGTALSLAATSANTPFAIVRRDGSGGVSAGALTLSGFLSHSHQDGLLSTGTFGSGVIPATGGGTRLMWYPQKAAFRAGSVAGSQWDDVNIGPYSVAFGLDSLASGLWATVGGGVNNNAPGMGATVSGGVNNVVAGDSATVGGGAVNSASQYGATVAGGLNNTAGLLATVSGGFGNTATGVYATIPGGRNNQALGIGAFAAGQYANAAEDGSFVWGDTSGSTSNGVDSFTVRASGGSWFYSGLLSGVNLPAGGGAWLALSDVAMKENWRDLDGESILGKLATMRIGEWNYITQPAAIRHAGPTAQDFHAAFGLGESPKGINTIDADGIALVAIQALEKRTRDLDMAMKAIATLQAQMEQLEKRLAQLQAVR